jgi:DNA-binding response OmpR family regulator
MSILIVDDDVELVGLLRFLTGAGYEVVTAFDGEQALRRLRDHTPELVILTSTCCARWLQVLEQLRNTARCR